jgi:hypothetical protein
VTQRVVGAAALPAPVTRSTAPPDPQRAWTAEVEWHETGGEARFIVSARPLGTGGDTTIAESPPLAWPPTDAASVDALTDAAQALHAAMLSAGWTALQAGTAWYAKRFAWEPTAPSAAEPAAAPPPADSEEAPNLFAPVPAWPESTAGRWRCEITWDAGWAESRFQAVIYRPRRRRGRAIGASTGLPWLLMGRPDARSEEHREAVWSLASALDAAGWERAGQGSSWYSERFAWPHDVAPPDRLDPVRRPIDGQLSENRAPTRI